MSYSSLNIEASIPRSPEAKSIGINDITEFNTLAEIISDAVIIATALILASAIVITPYQCKFG